ncbi:hypothetical protein JIN86_08180 [Lysinibacillus sp. HST-98]|uniref:hypothetical protein n=1 Tax=Lysinibacillus TaxID=400634 RepID=UPI0001DA513D|nr:MULTISPECIES: hypothetical protein [Lysinibacillus]EFI70391.1 hypothetical protein BFZC1_01967 [Lysinibacillus fusiformis ZC1]EKU43279.1 hypothetical protein C518_1682 [Lysinibacillus fusiformis ZB2]MBL3729578.1 hypothetical protein [Lysinibacillus sp. HST-98]MBU5253764.1 hypothetical protein [Lysinibacillus capsici]MED4701034.1 hypothetical protein [Lysinibacillus capsici]
MAPFTGLVEETSEVAALLAHHGIDITSSVPLDHTIPIPLLDQKGVQISLTQSLIISNCIQVSLHNQDTVFLCLSKTKEYIRD